MFLLLVDQGNELIHFSFQHPLGGQDGVLLGVQKLEHLVHPSIVAGEIAHPVLLHQGSQFRVGLQHILGIPQVLQGQGVIPIYPLGIEAALTIQGDVTVKHHIPQHSGALQVLGGPSGTDENTNARPLESKQVVSELLGHDLVFIRDHGAVNVKKDRAYHG